MKIYNKLVRDKIPEIMRADGAIPVVRTLEEKEYLLALIEKLKEETAEFETDHSLEELADISEVLKSLTSAIGETPKTLETTRQDKAAKRGGFEKRIFLEHAK